MGTDISSRFLSSTATTQDALVSVNSLTSEKLNSYDDNETWHKRLGSKRITTSDSATRI